MKGQSISYDEQVLAVVEKIPPGRVMSYGDVAEYLGAGGPRQVGQVMSRGGDGWPWWRVVRADGSPVRGHEAQCLARLQTEATPMRPDGSRVDMRRARWDGRRPGSPLSPAGRPAPDAPRRTSAPPARRRGNTARAE